MALLKLYLHIFDQLVQEILIPHLQSSCKFIDKKFFQFYAITFDDFTRLKQKRRHTDQSIVVTSTMNNIVVSDKL